MALLLGRILAWLAAKGITPLVPDEVELFSDGTTTVIRSWHPRLGPLPTAAQLAAITDAAAIAAIRQRERVADIDTLMMRTLARAVHVRFGRADAATMSAATWRTILETAWDAEHG